MFPSSHSKSRIRMALGNTLHYQSSPGNMRWCTHNGGDVRLSEMQLMLRRAACAAAAVTFAGLTTGAQTSRPPRSALVATLDSIAGAPVKTNRVAGMAVAVVNGRDTLLFKGYGLADIEHDVAVTPRTVFRIGSVTKQFTSSAVM